MRRLTRRAASLAALLLVLLAFVASWLGPPVVAVGGDSMEPTLSHGDLVVVESTDPTALEEGNVVVVDVPPVVQQEYGYPDRIVHRVVAVDREGDRVTYRTAGDNTGEDPFTVRPEHVEGEASEPVAYVGYPLLYLQSVWGRLYLVSLVVLYLLSIYSDSIERRARDVRRRYLEPSAEVLDRLDEMESGIDEDVSDVDESLDAFAVAMDEYATHLASHTEAVQEMGAAAAEIRDAVDRQNEMLERQNEVLERVEAALPNEDAEGPPTAGGSLEDDHQARGVDDEES